MFGVLFDIDGTILRAAGAGRRALARGYANLTGLPLAETTRHAETLDFRGSTDAVSFSRLSELLGYSAPDLSTAYAAYLEALRQTLAEAEVELLPGVGELIASLEARDDVLVGILTGNIRAGAALKLRTVGLHRLVDQPGGFGDDGVHRPELAERARDRMAKVGAHRLIVIGDTPHDVTAGQHVGATTIAVCTGWSDPESLHTTGADAVVKDLSDPSVVLQLLKD